MPVQPLPLPTAERTAVFRAAIALLQADPTLRSVVRTWIVWDGTPNETRELQPGDAPAIRLTPLGAGDEWMSPDSVVGALVIQFETVTAGTNVDDAVNLWRAVIAAMYDPQSRSFPEVQAKLRACGAYPPSPKFTLPVYQAAVDETCTRGSARMQIMVQTKLGSRGIIQS